jgi:ribonuclease R
VVEFGIFVELGRWFVEGLVKVEDLGGAPELDPVQHALVDRASGRAYRVGDKLRVLLVSASPARRRIELALAEEGRAAPRGERAERPARDERRERARPAAVSLADRLERARRTGKHAGVRERRGHGHDEAGRGGKRHAGEAGRKDRRGKGRSGKPGKRRR